MAWIAGAAVLLCRPAPAQTWEMSFSDSPAFHVRPGGSPRLPPEAAARRAEASGTVSVERLAAPVAAKQRLKKALRAYRKKHFQKALRLLDQAAWQAPRWATIYLLRGIVCLRQGLLPPARKDLQTALRLQPGNGLELTAMAQFYGREQREAKQLFYLNQATRAQKAPWQAYFDRSILELKQGRTHAALRDAWQGLSDEPPSPPAGYVILGNAYSRLGRKTQAIGAYKKYLKLRPRGRLAQATRLVIRNLQRRRPK